MFGLFNICLEYLGVRKCLWVMVVYKGFCGWVKFIIIDLRVFFYGFY